MALAVLFTKPSPPMDSLTNRPLTPGQLAEAARKLRASTTNQTQAAEEIGVTQSQVSKAERGDLRYLSTVVRLVERTGEYEVSGPFYIVSKKG